MDIREILALEPSTASIKKIDNFLSNLTPNHRDYPRALAHLAYITFQMGDVSGAFQILFNYLEICIDKEKPTIYNTLIKIYYIQKDYDNVLQMIENKKKYLPNYNKIAYYEDLITYYHNIDNSSELIRTILIYLDDDISDERRLKALIRLSEEYLKNSDYERFNEKNRLIQSLALSLAEDSIYQNARYKEAYVLVKEGSFPKALVLVDEMLEIHHKKELRAKLLTLKLEILVSLGEYRRASIFEAEYEYEVMEAELETKIDFARQCIILYEALNNRFNKSTYEEKLEGLLEELDKQTLTSQKPKKQKSTKQTIELNFLKNQARFTPVTITNEPSVETKKVIHNEDSTMIETGSKMAEIAEIFIKLNKQVFSQFRDYLRQFFIVLGSVAVFDEAYLLTKNNKYYGYHYKKERLYDKKTETLSLNDTVLLEVIDNNEEVVVSDSTKTTYVNIVTNKLYKDEEQLSLLCFPLTNASLLFTRKGMDLLTGKLNYETLKLAIAYLELKWNNEQNELYLLKKHHDHTFMLEHIVSGYKKQFDNYVFLSKTACEMFNSREALSIQEFYNYINVNDLFNYRKIVEDLIAKKITEASVRYSSNISGCTKYFQEDFKIDEDGVILSVINDVTKEVLRMEENIFMAHYDPVSGAYNKSKLVCDLEELINLNKFSLFAFNVKGFKNYSEIYGYDFTDQLIYAIAKFLKEYDKDNSIYHFDGDKFILALKGANDKRAMIKYAKEITAYLTKKLKELNHRLNISFEVGILRYPTDTTDKEAIKLIDYVLSALTSAHNDTETRIRCYSKEDYKNQFFQSQLATHVSEAIDLNHLMLNYRQVVDVGSNGCDHYYVSLNLSNYSVNEELIYEILKKRNMVKTIERYMIHKGLFELSEIYKSIKLYVNLSFKVSKETLLDETFKDYVLEQLKFFSIPKTAITICYNDEVSKEVFEVLKSLNLNQILISSTNFEVLKQFPLYYYYYKLPNDIKVIENEFIISLNDICNKRNINFVLDNVNNKELIAHYVQNNIKLYSGKVYSALLTCKDIIKSFLA